MLATKVFCLIPSVLALAIPRQTGCTSNTLPTSFTISDFTAISSDNGITLSEYTFQYQAFSATDNTGATITCSYNSSSVPVTIKGKSDRWSCDDPLTQFLMSSGSKLTMVQSTCIQNNEATYEASGSVQPSLSCTGNADPIVSRRDLQICSSSKFSGSFRSLVPIQIGA